MQMQRAGVVVYSNPNAQIHADQLPVLRIMIYSGLYSMEDNGYSRYQTATSPWHSPRRIQDCHGVFGRRDVEC